MYKQWGEGDERLLPIYPEYKNHIIRWGKEEAEEAVVNKNKQDHGREFLSKYKSIQMIDERII